MMPCLKSLKLASEPRRYSTKKSSRIWISLSSSGRLSREKSKDFSGFAVFA
jgi:hypothetical protein